METQAGRGCRGAPVRGGGGRKGSGGIPAPIWAAVERVASHHLLLALVATAAAVERREQVEAKAEAAADGGR